MFLYIYYFVIVTFGFSGKGGKLRLSAKCHTKMRGSDDAIFVFSFLVFQLVELRYFL